MCYKTHTIHQSEHQFQREGSIKIKLKIQHVIYSEAKTPGLSNASTICLLTHRLKLKEEVSAAPLKWM